jgi:hypothetical protein
VRWKIEDFLRRWRSRYEGNRALWVVVLVVLVALLLVRRIRVLRVLVPAAIGGIVAIGIILWVPPAPLLTNSSGPVVKNGVAAIVVCGNKRDGMRWSATDIAPEPGTGAWSVEERNGCDYYYHHPPDATQRENRHERAEQERGKLSPNLSGSREMLQNTKARHERALQ